METNKFLLLTLSLLALTACGNSLDNYDASGTFEATEVIISSEANGKIMQFDVKEGQLLKAGQEVGCIDTLQLYLKNYLDCRQSRVYPENHSDPRRTGQPGICHQNSRKE